MLTGVVIVKNESAKIEKLVSSLHFCDEIILVDNCSTDGTCRIIEKKVDKILRVETDDFSELRNIGLMSAQYTWILFVDADEVVTEDLRKEIIAKTHKKNLVLAYYIKREEYFLGKHVRYGEIKAAREKGFIRLVKKGSGTWKGRVHETFSVQGETGTLYHPLLHYPHDTIQNFLLSVNFYSTLRAEELMNEGKRSHILDIIFTPFAKFMYTFFILGGFRDGSEGFIYSYMMSLHSFLTRAKVYLNTHTKKLMKDKEALN